jgi:RNA polymerase sigma factor (sigma-70 family)
MDTKKKLYIRIGNQVEQVTEEVYREYFKMDRRERYLEERDLVHGRFLYSQFDNVYEDVLGEEMIADSLAEDLCDAIVSKIMIEKLKECLSLLSDEDLNLIIQLFYEEKSQRQLSEESGVPVMTISDRKNRVLKKLKKTMENKK